MNFTDRSHEGRTEFRSSPRQFNSFSEMAEENAITEALADTKITETVSMLENIDIQQVTDMAVSKVDEIVAEKEQELLEI